MVEISKVSSYLVVLLFVLAIAFSINLYYSENLTGLTIFDDNAKISDMSTCPNQTTYGWQIKSNYTLSTSINCIFVNISPNVYLFLNSSVYNKSITIQARDYIEIGNGARISANGMGYSGVLKCKSHDPYLSINGSGPGGGKTDCGNHGGNGGAYGGIGGYGQSNVYAVSNFYGSSLLPTLLGSGGGAGEYGDGGDGGGAIRINTSLLINKGKIEANGENGEITYINNCGGGGSGGSILVNTNKLYGCYFEAKGGNGGYRSDIPSFVSGGAGSGGRIAIYYNETNCFDSLLNFNVSVQSGFSYNNQLGANGENGTFIMYNRNSENALIYGGFIISGLTGNANESNNIYSIYNISYEGELMFNNLTIKNARLKLNSSNILISANNMFFNNTYWETKNKTLIISYNNILKDHNSTYIPGFNLLVGSSYGIIEWNQKISRLKTLNSIVIDRNFISVNSDNDKGLNKSAILTFYNVGSSSYKIYRNNRLCTSNYCHNYWINSEGFNVNVTSFTNYSIKKVGNISINLSKKIVNPLELVNVYGQAKYNSTVNITNTSIYLYLNNSLINVTTGWNCGLNNYNCIWKNKREINLIEKSGLNLIDYPFKIIINTTDLISKHKLNSNCSDFRFVEGNNKEIPYWIELCNKTDSEIWFKTNLTANSMKKIVMYYGNRSAKSKSNGSKVFNFFDGFDGNSVNLKLWNLSNSTATSYSVGNGYFKILGPYTGIRSRYIFGQNKSVVVAFREAHVDGSGNPINDGWTYRLPFFGFMIYNATSFDLSGRNSSIFSAIDDMPEWRYWDTSEHDIPNTVSSGWQKYYLKWNSSYATGYNTNSNPIQRWSQSLDSLRYWYYLFGWTNSGIKPNYTQGFKVEWYIVDPTGYPYFPSWLDYVYERKIASVEPNVTLSKEESTLSLDGNGKYNYTFRAPLIEGIYRVKVNLSYSDYVITNNATLEVTVTTIVPTPSPTPDYSWCNPLNRPTYLETHDDGFGYYCGICPSSCCALKSNHAIAVGINLTNLKNISLIYVGCYSGDGGTHIINCSSNLSYDLCVENKNDGLGNRVILGINCINTTCYSNATTSTTTTTTTTTTTVRSGSSGGGGGGGNIISISTPQVIVTPSPIPIFTPPVIEEKIEPKQTPFIEEPSQINQNPVKLSNSELTKKITPYILCNKDVAKKGTTISSQYNLHYSNIINLQEGYNIINSPLISDCNGNLFNAVFNIPDTYQDIKIYKCKANICKEVFANKIDFIPCDLPPTDLANQKLNNLFLIANVTLKPTVKKGNVFENYGIRVIDLDNLNSKLSIEIAQKEFNSPTNKMIEIKGAPILIDSPKISKIELSVPFKEDAEGYVKPSLFVYNNNDWTYLGGDWINDTIISTVDLSQYIDSENKTYIAKGDLVCEDCEKDKLNLVYDANGTRNAIILTHGFVSSSSTFRDFIGELKNTNQPWDIYVYDYDSDSSLDEIALRMERALDVIFDNYDNVYLLSHSLGGLVTQQALFDRVLHGKEIKNNVKLILVTTPNLGSPLAPVYETIYQLFQGDISILPRSQLLKDLYYGRQIQKVPGVKYYVIAGTKPLEFILPYAKITTTDYFDEANDGIVSLKSAYTVGNTSINNRCENFWDLKYNHNEMIHESVSRKIIGRIISEEIEKTEKVDSALIGFNQYYQLTDSECDEGSVYVLTGKKYDQPIVPVAYCNCGDGVCGIGEDDVKCPTDCLKTKGSMACSISFDVILILCILNLAIAGILMINNNKWFRYFNYLLLLINGGFLVTSSYSCVLTKDYYVVPLMWIISLLLPLIALVKSYEIIPLLKNKTSDMSKRVMGGSIEKFTKPKVKPVDNLIDQEIKNLEDEIKKW